MFRASQSGELSSASMVAENNQWHESLVKWKIVKRQAYDVIRRNEVKLDFCFVIS